MLSAVLNMSFGIAQVNVVLGLSAVSNRLEPDPELVGTWLIRTSCFVHYKEVVLFSEILLLKMIVLGYYETILCREVVLFSEVMENDHFGIL